MRRCALCVKRQAWSKDALRHAQTGETSPMAAPAKKPESCGPRTSAACTVRMTAGTVGGAQSAIRAHRNTCEASRWCTEVRELATQVAGQSLQAPGDVYFLPLKLSVRNRPMASSACADAL